MKYATLLNRNKTPQTRPIPGSKQIRNSAGGFAWAVHDWTMLDRFLILGSESGTYYINAPKLTMDHANNVLKLLDRDGRRVVERIVEVSEKALSPKNDPAIFALALAASHKDAETRRLALQALPKVCRTGTHLFGFVESVDQMRGWGRALRKAIARWYEAKESSALEYQLLKYKQRGGWGHRDLLRLAHPKPTDDNRKALYKWAVSGEVSGNLPLIEAAEKLKGANTAEVYNLIREFRLPREAVPTELLREAKVWEALLADMPLGAMLRNLGNLSKNRVVTAGSDAAARIEAELTQVDRLQKARIHPIAVLSALATYARGRGVLGDGTWEPVASIVDSLDRAFYAAFANVPSTGLRLVVGLDVSGSMVGTRVHGIEGFSCREAAAAMALVTLATERAARTVAFDTQAYSLALSANQRLDDVVKVLGRTGGGGTDLAQPVLYALDAGVQADAFVIYTDSETWAGQEHLAQALQRYRAKTGIPAKLVVVAMAGNRYTVGDPRDAGVLNVIGLDASVPQVIAQFLRG